MYSARYSMWSGPCTKSTADMNVRSMSSSERPSACIARPIASYIQGCGCLFLMRRHDQIATTSLNFFSAVNWRTVSRTDCGDSLCVAK